MFIGGRNNKIITKKIERNFDRFFDDGKKREK